MFKDMRIRLEDIIEYVSLVGITHARSIVPDREIAISFGWSL